MANIDFRIELDADECIQHIREIQFQFVLVGAMAATGLTEAQLRKFSFDGPSTSVAACARLNVLIDGMVHGVLNQKMVKEIVGVI